MFFILRYLLFFPQLVISLSSGNVNLTVGVLRAEHINHCLLPRTTDYNDRNVIRRMSQEFVLTSAVPLRVFVHLLNQRPPFRTLVSIKGITSFINLQQEGLRPRLSPQIKWLLETTTNVTELNFFIPIDCDLWLAMPLADGSYSLQTVYNMKENTSTIKFEYGILKTGQQLIKTDARARTNFFGVPLIVYVPLPDPCFYHLACLHYKLVSDFGRALNFTLKEITTQDLKEKHNGKYDIVANIAAFHVYSNFQDMLGPVLKAEMSMFIRDSYGKHADYWHSFLHPFEDYVWISLCGYLVLSSIIIVLIQYSSGGKDITSSAFTPLDAIAYQGVNPASGTWSARWSMFMPRVLVAVLYPAYGAAIVAFLTVKITTWPFTDIIGFRMDGTYKVSGNTDMQDIASRLQVKEPELLITYEENIKKICQDPKFVFLTYNSLLDKYSVPCKILRIPTPVTYTFTGLSLHTDSPIKSVFKITLLNMHSSGLLDRLTAERTIKELERGDFSPIEQVDITMPLILLLTGMILSILLLELEMFCHQQRLRKFIKMSRKTRIRKIRI